MKHRGHSQPEGSDHVAFARGDRDNGKTKRPFTTRRVRCSGRFSWEWVLLAVSVVVFFSSLAGRHQASQAPQLVPLHQRADQVVLVTGAAGFIGYHLCRALSVQGVRVVGLDNFNDYYDPNLKYTRALELQKHGVGVVQMDLCDEDGLRGLFRDNAFTHVVNLAAQAGVRHSVEAPGSYVRSNLECFSALLHVLAQQPPPRPPLVFASSSSVYGPASPVPFSTRTPTGPPGNVYAASKKANELLARTYAAHHGLQAVGLRFFTVYGPWGRPDMAAYKFAERMATGRPIPLYDDPALQRDFTYVDDIVQGILGVLAMRPFPGFAVYNLGHGVPEDVTRLVAILERLQQRKADLELLPVPPTELRRTWADISDSQRAFGFQPQTGLAEGMARFFRWYGGYKRYAASTAGQAEVAAFRGTMEKAAAAREAAGRKRRADGWNMKLQASQSADLKQWVRFAEQRDISLPAAVDEKVFVFHPQTDSPGGLFLSVPGASIEALSAACNRYRECVGFTSGGWLKKSLLPRAQWKVDATSPLSSGLYVAENMNLCAADLHHCGPRSVCRADAEPTYTCECAQGYVDAGPACIPAQSGHQYTPDALDWLDQPPHKKSTPYVFFQGVDVPGGDVMYADEAVKLDGPAKMAALRTLCDQLPACIGFNTNGFLKHAIAPMRHWYAFSLAPADGTYILDVDYCALQSAGCSPGSHCARQGPGRYGCQCDNAGESLVLVNKGENAPELWKCLLPADAARFGGPTPRQFSGKVVPRKGTRPRREQSSDHVDPGPAAGLRAAHARSPVPPPSPAAPLVHVAVVTDREHYDGVPAVITSLRANTQAPDRLRIHAVYMQSKELQPATMYLPDFLRCHGISVAEAPASGVVGTIPFDPDRLRGLISVHGSKAANGNLASPANFARFFLHELLPHIDRVVYLDVDTVVQGRVERLWDDSAPGEHAVSAVPREVPLSQYLSAGTRPLFARRYGKEIDLGQPSFNAGVLLLNLRLWRAERLTDEILFWMKANHETPLWTLGTQPPLLLATYGRWGRLPASWNVNGLGYRDDYPRGALQNADLLHWTGVGKPWLPSGKHRRLWKRYLPPMCSQHGTCSPHGCVCDPPHSGHLCATCSGTASECSKTHKVPIRPAATVSKRPAAGLHKGAPHRVGGDLPAELPASEAVHVAVVVERKDIRGGVTALLSIRQHARQPGRLQFVVVAPEEDLELVRRRFACAALVARPTLPLRFVGVAPASAERWRRLQQQFAVRPGSLATLAPLLLNDAQLGAENVVVVGTDVLVQGDVGAIFPSAEGTLSQGHVVFADEEQPTDSLPTALRSFLASPPSAFLGHTSLYRLHMPSVAAVVQRLALGPSPVPPGAAQHVPAGGSGPADSLVQVILASGASSRAPGDDGFVRGLGYRKGVPAATLSRARVLSWEGKHKPWLAGGLYQEVWDAYHNACSG